ncbi:MAG: metallophosphoesterase [Chitinophagaceae bacterium]|nr:metallophosphoesterase [Chitinophagaceae bacterium]
MPDIKYVVFSDLHMGAENSLMTNLKYDTPQTDTTKPSPVMVAMIDCLRQLIGKNEDKSTKPKLILNGDLIELALTSTNRACMAFQRFIELCFPPNEEDFLFDKEIVFLPGNHDHNLWEIARHTWYMDVLRKIKPGDYVPNELHSTKVFHPEKIKSLFLNSLIECYPHLKDVSVNVIYPAYGLIKKDHSKCVLFFHGHYSESMYWAMTNFRSDIFPDRQQPMTFEEIEIENYAWVDFFWSTLGRSGSVGKDINLIYDKLQDGTEVNQMISNIADSLTKRKRNFIVRYLERKALKFVLTASLGKMAANERNEPDVDLTPEVKAGLKRLMEVPLFNQLNKELQNDIPDDITFLFGHTHKPFMKWFHPQGYPNPLKVINTGGWVVDTLSEQPLHGGSIGLIDEELNAITLEMYKEGNFKPTPGWLTHDHTHDPTHNDFLNKINQIIKTEPEPWLAFETIVEKEVHVRYRNLEEIIKEKD